MFRTVGRKQSTRRKLTDTWRTRKLYTPRPWIGSRNPHLLAVGQQCWPLSRRATLQLISGREEPPISCLCWILTLPSLSQQRTVSENGEFEPALPSLASEVQVQEQHCDFATFSLSLLSTGTQFWMPRQLASSSLGCFIFSDASLHHCLFRMSDLSHRVLDLILRALPILTSS